MKMIQEQPRRHSQDTQQQQCFKYHETGGEGRDVHTVNETEFRVTAVESYLQQQSGYQYQIRHIIQAGKLM